MAEDTAELSANEYPVRKSSKEAKRKGVRYVVLHFYAAVHFPEVVLMMP